MILPSSSWQPALNSLSLWAELHTGKRNYIAFPFSWLAYSPRFIYIATYIRTFLSIDTTTRLFPLHWTWGMPVPLASVIGAAVDVRMQVPARVPVFSSLGINLEAELLEHMAVPLWIFEKSQQWHHRTALLPLQVCSNSSTRLPVIFIFFSVI